MFSNDFTSVLLMSIPQLISRGNKPNVPDLSSSFCRMTACRIDQFLHKKIPVSWVGSVSIKKMRMFFRRTQADHEHEWGRERPI